MLSKLLKSLQTSACNDHPRDLSRRRSFLLRQFRLVLIAARGIRNDRLQLRASALTLYTLLAIVPVIAMAFAIAKGFGFESTLKQRLLLEFPGHEAVMQQVVAYANNLLERTRSGMMAGIGVVVLFWASINVLGHLERSLNDIWDVKKSRSIWRKFSDYLTIMVLSPVLIILSGSVTVYIKTQVASVLEKSYLLGTAGPFIYYLLGLVPFFMIGSLFSLIYLMMPNTKVRFLSGILAGFVAGGLYQILQQSYINFQFLIAKYNAIYGSFAALPLFMVWLHLSWMIVFFGAEISFAHQNSESCEFDLQSHRVSFGQKKRLALVISHLIVKRFGDAEAPLSMNRIAAVLEIPIQLVHDIVDDLTESGILVELAGDGQGETVYQPAVDTDLLSMAYVVAALEKRGAEDLPVAQSEAHAAIAAALTRFQETLEGSPDNMRLKDI